MVQGVADDAHCTVLVVLQLSCDKQGYSGDRQGYSGDRQGYSSDRQGYSGDRQGYSGDRQGESWWCSLRACSRYASILQPRLCRQHVLQPPKPTVARRATSRRHGGPPVTFAVHCSPPPLQH